MPIAARRKFVRRKSTQIQTTVAMSTSRPAAGKLHGKVTVDGARKAALRIFEG
jgi:hypothetical protein